MNPILCTILSLSLALPLDALPQLEPRENERFTSPKHTVELEHKAIPDYKKHNTVPAEQEVDSSSEEQHTSLTNSAELGKRASFRMMNICPDDGIGAPDFNNGSSPWYDGNCAPTEICVPCHYDANTACCGSGAMDIWVSPAQSGLENLFYKTTIDLGTGNILGGEVILTGVNDETHFFQAANLTVAPEDSAGNKLSTLTRLNSGMLEYDAPPGTATIDVELTVPNAGDELNLYSFSW